MADEINDPIENFQRWTSATEEFFETATAAFRLLTERFNDLSRRVEALERSIPWYKQVPTVER